MKPCMPGPDRFSRSAGWSAKRPYAILLGIISLIFLSQHCSALSSDFDSLSEELAILSALRCQTYNAEADDCQNVDLGAPRETLTAGHSHTCYLNTLGEVRCWGEGAYGRLGYGNSTTIGDTETPDTAGIVPLPGTAVRLSAGMGHTCAVLANGHLYCWGQNHEGQLGYGHTNNIGNNEAITVVGPVPVGDRVQEVSAGYDHTCVVTMANRVRCWGRAQVVLAQGDGTEAIGDSEYPSSIPPIELGVAASRVEVGRYHACILTTTNAVRCWGSAGNGRLGTGNTDNIGDDETPVALGDISLGDTATQISIDGTGSHSCALLSSGNVTCWGAGGVGRLGYSATANIGDDELPSAAGTVNLGGTATHLGMGNQHSCAVLSTGNAICWGKGNNGRLGYSATAHIGDDETPAANGTITVGGTVVQIAAGHSHSCALLDTGTIRCWGKAIAGQLGYGNTNDIGDDETPATAGDISL